MLEKMIPLSQKAIIYLHIDSIFHFIKSAKDLAQYLFLECKSSSIGPFLGQCSFSLSLAFSCQNLLKGCDLVCCVDL